jgi:hypothetical protein
MTLGDRRAKLPPVSVTLNLWFGGGRVSLGRCGTASELLKVRRTVSRTGGVAVIAGVELIVTAFGRLGRMLEGAISLDACVGMDAGGGESEVEDVGLVGL